MGELPRANENPFICSICSPSESFSRKGRVVLCQAGLLSMAVQKSIRDNLKFLIAEVGSQVTNLQAFFETRSINMAQRILDRSGYAYNLKMRIHNSCFSQYGSHKNTHRDPLSLRVMESIATDLERIAELCRDCIHHMEYVRDKRSLSYDTYISQLDRVVMGINLIEQAFEENDTQLALKIGQVEQKLDQAYKGELKHYTRDLKRKKHTEDLIPALFVAHSIEQMGDVLLNISEAIISANLGQPVNIDRYHSMKASVEQLGADEEFSDLVIEPIAETRSGSGISGISMPDQEQDGYVAIYKDGKKQKLKEEREGVESWHEIYPGLAPKILHYKKRGQSASLLIEHLAGLTLSLIHISEPTRPKR